MLLTPSLLRTRGHEPNATASIKVTATSVAVDVIVTDSKGSHMSGLTADDFRVYENDAPQKIVSFTPPGEPAAPAPPEDRSARPTAGTGPPRQGQTPDTGRSGRHEMTVGSANDDEMAQLTRRAGAKPAPAHITGAENLANVRFITVVFDIGDIQPGNLKHAGDAAEKYLKTQVAPQDFVAIYRVDSSLHLAQPFTQDKDAAARAVKKITEHVPKGYLTTQQRFQTQEEIDGLLKVCLNIQEAKRADRSQLNASIPPTRNGCNWNEIKALQNYLWGLSVMQARALLVALRAIAQTYSDVPGRKNVVVFSEGFLHSPEAQGQLNSAIEVANRANVAFYIIDASGLTAPYGAENRDMELAENQEALVAAMAGPGTNKFDWIGRLGRDNVHDDLQQLAAATGGILMKNQNDLLAGLSRVDDDLRQTYTLVYQPTNTHYDGSFRHIRVELAKPRCRLRYRLGYWAIPPGEEMLMSPAAAQLLAGVASGELKSSFTPELNGTVLLAPNGSLAAPVRVTLPGKEVKFEKDPDKDVHHGGIIFLLLARDSAGHIASVHQRFINLEFDSQHLADFQKQALTIDARMAIPKLEPLRLEVILQFANGAIAIGDREVAVASRSTGLQLTGLLLTNRLQAAGGTPDPADPLYGGGFQLEMPSKSQFASTDRLMAIFGAVGLAPDASSGKAQLRLSYSIRQGDALVGTPPPELTVGAAGQNLLRMMKQIDLGSLGPGNYTLQVTAENSSGQVAASRSADFTIVSRAAEGGESSALEPESFVAGGDENPPGVIRHSESSRVTAGRGTPSVLNAPLNELQKTAHELKGIAPATGQDELPMILKRVGDNVESFVRNFQDTASTEEIQQQVLDSGNRSTTYKFRYLALTEQGTPLAGLHELRQDSEGHEVDAASVMKRSPIVTQGFVSLPLLFLSQYRTGSDFRLLGRQTLEGREIYVLGFAQRNAAVFLGHMNLSGHWTTFLTQGVAWVDATTCQILRMKTWLLPGPAQTRLANITPRWISAKSPSSINRWHSGCRGTSW